MNYFSILLLAICYTIVLSPAAFAQLQTKPYTFESESGKSVEAEWGTFVVPLKHNEKDGNTIELSFVRFKSTNPNPGYPIVYLAGGPGGSGISAARGKRFPLFMALRNVADVILLDQRGTGASNFIPQCSANEAFPVNTPITQESYTAYLKRSVQNCIDFWREKGVDLSAYNTRENALDLKTLRKVLDVEKLNLLGISYGSTLALAAIKMMPEHIDRVVLASPLSMGQTLRFPTRTQDFLERVNALIKADTTLKKIYPDLLGTMKTVLDRFEKKPVQVSIQASNGEQVNVTIGKFPIQLATISMLKNPENLKMLPIMYSALAASFYRPIVQQIYVSLSNPMANLTGMGVAVRAKAYISPKREKLVQQQAKTTLMGNTLNFSTKIFQSAGIEQLDKNFSRPVHSDIPSLILTGTLDGRTYPAGHKEILKKLSNGSEVVIENAGHDLFMSSPKVTADIVDFLSHQPVKYKHIKIPPPDFITPAEMRARMGRNNGN